MVEQIERVEMEVSVGTPIALDKPLQGYWPSLNSKDEMCVYNDKYPNYMKTDIEFYFFDSINDCCRAWFKGDVKSCIEESTNYAHEDGNRWGSPPRHSSKAGKP